MDFFLFPILHACLIPFLPGRWLRRGRSVLIRKEMVLVIMSTPINGDDNEQYYFYAMFCVGDPASNAH